MNEPKVKIGIFGSSGFTGSELIRWILTHPKLELTFAHSRHHAGKKISDVYPYLKNMTSLQFTNEKPETLIGNIDAMFLALAHGEAKEIAETCKTFSGPIIDLTMDHRLDDSFVYGITELMGKKISETNRVANPGCFATACILAAAPFVTSNVASDTLFFNCVTGSSGAGQSPTATTHHPFRDENLFAYKLFQHQHEPEIVKCLDSVTGKKHNVILASHSGPFVRGIHTTLHFQLTNDVPSQSLDDMAETFFEKTSFVRVRQTPPSLKDVIGSNFCDVHVTSRGRDVVVITVLDNLIKGAAGQAIQNLNVTQGWSEREGLWSPPNFL